MNLIKLTTKEFERMAKLILDRTGIHLPESKLSLLSNRLRRRLRELGLDTFQEYHDLLLNPAKYKVELPHFLSAVTTNETYFFRNENLWKFIRGTWIPETVARKAKAGARTLRVWSAASSSGEEAYTIGICLQEDIPDFAEWRIQITGSDISDRVLQQARNAEFNDYALSKTTPQLTKKWFESCNGVYTLSKAIRKMVTFQYHNLRDAFPEKNFDLVFLRNVLMYFDTPMKLKVLETVTNALAVGGILVVGDVDPIRNTPELNQALTLEYAGPNLYMKPLPERMLAGATS